MMRFAGVVCVVVSAIPVCAVLAEDGPKVVSTVPAAGAGDVDPKLGEILVTFDTPMQKDSWSVVYTTDTRFPEMAEENAISFRDDKTCVVKVKLEPNTAYGLGFNSKTRTGFKSADGAKPAVPFELRFKTGSGAAPATADGPNVVKTEPANGTKDLEAGTFDLTIVFSEPMKQGQASITTPSEGPKLNLIGKPAWKDAKTFVVPIMLAPGTTYRVGINTGENKRFVSAGDGTPAVGLELTFSVAGAAAAPVVPAPANAKAPASPTEPPTRSPGSAVQLRHNYQKGDAGRIKMMNNVDMKLRTSTGQEFPVGQKAGLNCIEEVLTVENGQPAEVNKLISEYMLLVTNPQTGQTQAAPRLETPVSVKVDRRQEPVKVEVTEGQPSNELMGLLSQDQFLDVLPRVPVKVGESYDFPPESLAELKKAFDPKGTGTIDLKLTCLRIGPTDIEDARNEMFRAKGGGTPVTYTFETVEFGIAWKQSGTMENDVPFSLDAKGKVAFAIEAGIMLEVSVDGQMTVKPVQTQDENGQAVTITGNGTYSYRYTYEPIRWTRGAKSKQGSIQAAASPAEPTAAPKPAQTPSAAPGAAECPQVSAKESIAHQIELIKAGNVAELKACFTDRLKDQITDETVKAGRTQLLGLTLEDLVSAVEESEGLGNKTATIKMKNGRTLTTLVLTNGKWLADTVWFK